MRILAAFLFVLFSLSISATQAQAQSLDWWLKNYTESQTDLVKEMVEHGVAANEAIWKLYVANMNSFALGVIENVGKVTDKDVLVATYKELKMAEGTLGLVLKDEQSKVPPDRKFIADITVALVNVRNAMESVVAQYVLLGGNAADLEQLKIEPSPIIERLQKGMSDR